MIMSNIITVPVVDYKMDKMHFIIVMAVVIVLIFVFANPSGFFKAIFNGIINAVGSVGNGIATGVGQASNQISNSDPQQAADAIAANIDYFNKNVGNASSMWNASLYNANQDKSNLDYATLKNCCQNIYEEGLGTSIFGHQLTNGSAYNVYNPTGVPSLATCQSKVDVSNMVVVYQQLYGNDLLTDIVTSADNVNNNAPGNYPDKTSNAILLQNAFKSLDSLPTM